jgi:hypothetical protein
MACFSETYIYVHIKVSKKHAISIFRAELYTDSTLFRNVGFYLKVHTAIQHRTTSVYNNAVFCLEKESCVNLIVNMHFPCSIHGIPLLHLIAIISIPFFCMNKMYII